MSLASISSSWARRTFLSGLQASRNTICWPSEATRQHSTNLITGKLRPHRFVRAVVLWHIRESIMVCLLGVREDSFQASQLLIFRCIILWPRFCSAFLVVLDSSAPQAQHTTVCLQLLHEIALYSRTLQTLGAAEGSGILDSHSSGLRLPAKVEVLHATG